MRARCDRWFDARRFRFDYLFIFLVLLEPLLFRIDISSKLNKQKQLVPLARLPACLQRSRINPDGIHSSYWITIVRILATLSCSPGK
jgi:hypothetical protein